MHKRSVVVVVGLVVGALLITSLAIAAAGKKNFRAGDLVGYEENPDISTVATGSFTASVDEGAQTIEYELSYAGLEGTVLQAHIHFGKRAINGGITVFLCGTAASPGPAGTPTCPQSGTVSRTVGVGDILAPGTQGIEAGNFAELVAAMRNGSTYANVHSTKWPGGEIRAQINDG
jgi:CHRD domain